MSKITGTERLKKESLMRWMEDRGFTTETLATATGDSFSSIYMLTKGDRPINDAFKWRFAVAFGWEEANAVFHPTQPDLDLIPEPETLPQTPILESSFDHWR